MVEEGGASAAVAADCLALLVVLSREVSWSRGTMEMVGAMERERRGGMLTTEEAGMVVVLRSKDTDLLPARPARRGGIDGGAAEGRDFLSAGGCSGGEGAERLVLTENGSVTRGDAADHHTHFTLMPRPPEETGFFIGIGTLRLATAVAAVFLTTSAAGTEAGFLAGGTGPAFLVVMAGVEESGLGEGARTGGERGLVRGGEVGSGDG